MDAFKNGMAAVVTLFIVVGSTVLVVFLLTNVQVPDEDWKRYMTIFAVVEAVLYAAVGWLFGKEVHREQAEKAEEGRKDAETKARTASADAAGEAQKGRGLARAIIAAGHGGGGRGGFERASAGATPATPSAETMTTLVAQAVNTYDDL